MRKIIELEDHFKTGELTVQLVLPTRSGRFDVERVSKHASEALDYIKNVQPEPGKTHLLLLAMGGEETYGPNRNGDGFSEYPVRARGKESADRGERWWIAPGQELTKHYQSFETNPAHAFKHHQNKDPAKASGYVKKAFWNPRMHRVELLTLVDNEKDAEWIERVEAGELPAVSMGCRIKHDVCSRCGNRAPTRADYCKHAQMMNAVNPDGTKNFVYNPDPDFFDISRVFRPADRIGYTMKKVADVADVRLSADLGDEAEWASLRIAAARKLSEMDKVINGEPVATSTLSDDERRLVLKFRDHASAKLASAPSVPARVLQSGGLRRVVSAARRAGVILKDAEFAEAAASSMMGRPARLSAAALAKVAEAASAALELISEAPSLLDYVVDDCKLGEDVIDAGLDAEMRAFAEKRAYAGEMLYRRLVPEGVGLRDNAAPTTDLLHVGDATTTRGAAIDAQDAVTRAHMRNVLGGSALLLGGYKAMSAFPWLRKLQAPLAVGAGALGYGALSSRPGHSIETSEGFQVPNITEMAPKTAAIVHLVECARGPRARHDLSARRLARAWTPSSAWCSTWARWSTASEPSSPHDLGFCKARPIISLQRRPPMKLGHALSQIKGTQPTVSKTAAATPAAPAPTSVDAAGDVLRQAIKEATTPTETKTASQTAPVEDLAKLAADIASTEHEALTKEANFYGAAVADGFMARLAQYQDAAAKVANQVPAPAQAKTASADDSFEKFAAENPDLVREAHDLGYEKTKTDLVKLAEMAYVQAHNATVENIYKLACDSFVGGFSDTLKVLGAAS